MPSAPRMQSHLHLFRLFRRHSHQLSRVTLWGLTDGQSWLNGFPVRGRTDYPLLWDRDYQAKPFVRRIIEFGAGGE